MPEKFDFSKIEDQQKFEELPREEKDKVVAEAQEEAKLAPEDVEVKEEIGGEKLIERKKINVPEIGELEYFEKKVMFPEKIVKETGGIQGYIKKTIQWEELAKNVLHLDSQEKVDKFWADYNKLNKIQHEFIEAYNEGQRMIKIFNENKKMMKAGEREEMEKKIEEQCEKADGLGYKELELSQKPRYSKIIEKRNLLGSDLNKIIGTMTNDKFIKETFNHQFGWSSWGIGEKAWKYFKEDKLLLQKLFVASAEKEGRETTLLVPFFSFDRENKLIKRHKAEEFKEVSLENKKLYYLSPAALSTSRKGYIWELSNRVDISRILFGFGNRNKAFQLYLDKINRLYEKIMPQIEKEEEKEYGNASNAKPAAWRDAKYYKDSIKEYQGKGYAQRDTTEFGNHPRLPIIINNQEIPELRWCHADYASIPTKKGWNIIEMIT